MVQQGQNVVTHVYFAMSVISELPVLLLTVLHPPSAYGLTSDLVQCEPKVKILDLTSSIIGFEDSADSTTETRSITEIKKWILREGESKVALLCAEIEQPSRPHQRE